MKLTQVKAGGRAAVTMGGIGLRFFAGNLLVDLSRPLRAPYLATVARRVATPSCPPAGWLSLQAHIAGTLVLLRGAEMQAASLAMAAAHGIPVPQETMRLHREMIDEIRSVLPVLRAM